MAKLRPVMALNLKHYSFYYTKDGMISTNKHWGFVKTDRIIMTSTTKALQVIGIVKHFEHDKSQLEFTPQLMENWLETKKKRTVISLDNFISDHPEYFL